MSRRQSSITSFFTRTPKAEKKEEEEEKDQENLKTVEKIATDEKSVLKRSNAQTISASPVARTPKRARVEISSSSEDEEDSDDEFKLEGIESEEDDDECSEMEEEISEVMSEELSQLEETKESTTIIEDKMNEIMKSARRKSRVDGGGEEEASEQFLHETFDFLKPDKIRDASKRRPTDAEYDAKTLFVPPEFLNKQTPGHKQWWMIKSQHFDTIILFKVGKFYETYHMDAVDVVKALNIAFMKGSYAHAGFPEQTAPKFVDQLINHGYKVARVEQTETPQQLEERNRQLKGGKDKVVRREVCRVTSGGTRTYGVLDGVDIGHGSEIDATAKYLMAIKEMRNESTSEYGVCLIDTTTAKILLAQFVDDDYRSELRTLLANMDVVQVLVEKNGLSMATKSILNGLLASTPIEELIAKKQFVGAEEAVKWLSGDEYYGAEWSTWPECVKRLMDETSVLPKPAATNEPVLSSLGAVLWYLRKSLIDVDMISMRQVELYDGNTFRKEKIDKWDGKRLVVDGTALENLNIVPNGRESHQTSLYYVVNKCSTQFGKRLLRSWLLLPTCDPTELRQRQECVNWLSSPEATSFLSKSTVFLKKIPDLDRLLQKIHTIGLKYRAEKHPDSRAVMFDTLKINQRKIGELLATIDGFKCCNSIRNEYIQMQKDGEGCPILDNIIGNESDVEEIAATIEYFDRMFDRNAAEKSGKIIPNKGCDDEYEKAVNKVEEKEEKLEDYRKSIAKKYSCQIKFVASGKLKHVMEMPESAKVGSSFEMKSRRKGFVRYMTPELAEIVEELEEAQRERAQLADDATRRVYEQFGGKNSVWKKTVDAIAMFDCLVSLVLFAKSVPFDLCMPEFDFVPKNPFIDIENGVHPCLALNSRNEVTGTSSYIANSVQMGDNNPAVMLLTGPNMGGKSTLMRQTAVICILAHIGSMVPASRMRLSPIDRIFTRIGANDRIMCGQSTFFIELKETDVMLKNASVHSLLLIDELGRGTSTFDGTAIATAVLENIAEKLHCRTFFSTHYHSICNLFVDNSNVRLAHMKCMVDQENEEDPTMENVTFLYELESGVCPKSYGFYAAKLAGIDQDVVRNAYAESNRFVSARVDESLRCLIEKAADTSIGVDDLRRMVEAL